MPKKITANAPPADKTQDTHEEIVGDVVGNETVTAQVADTTEIVAEDEHDDEPTNDIDEQQSSPVTDTTANVVTLDQRAARIRQLQADVQRGMIEIGFELIAAKAEIGHGGWQKWLDTEFEWTDRTARYFMAVAERFGNRNTYSDLKPSTLKVMLALPAGDEDEFVAAMEAAGTPINKQSARELQQSVATWKKRNETHEPPPVESHDEDSDAGKMFVGGKPLDSIVGFVNEGDGDENSGDDATQDNLTAANDNNPVTNEPTKDDSEPHAPDFIRTIKNLFAPFEKDLAFRKDAVSFLETSLDYIELFGGFIDEQRQHHYVQSLVDFWHETEKHSPNTQKMMAIANHVMSLTEEIARDLNELATTLKIAADKLKAEATEKDSNKTEDK